MLKPETKTIKLIHTKIKALAPDIICHKISERFTNGWPDCKYIGLQGRHLYVEYKVDKNNLSALQKLMIENLLKHNVHVWIITKLDDNSYHILIHETNNNHLNIITPTPWISIINFLK